MQFSVFLLERQQSSERNEFLSVWRFIKGWKEKICLDNNLVWVFLSRSIYLLLTVLNMSLMLALILISIIHYKCIADTTITLSARHSLQHLPSFLITLTRSRPKSSQCNVDTLLLIFQLCISTFPRKGVASYTCRIAMQDKKEKQK